MKKNKINKIVLCCMLFVCPFLAMADDLDDGNGDVNDVPPAPISHYLPLAFVAAVGFGYVFLRGRKLAK